MSDLQLVGGVKKLNSQNYNYWSTCISSYLQGQDLWEVVNGAETTQPEEEDAIGVLRKWRIKAGKAMFILKTTVEDELLEHIKDSTTPNEAWEALSILFSKKNDTKLQLLENELLSVSQKELSIPKYFHKVKTLCREIGELDQQAKIGDARMKRIIIHGLKPEYRSFVAAIQGWPTQPTLGEFENLLASQEALSKQVGDLSVGSSSKSETEALYVEKSKGKNRFQQRSRGQDRHKHKEQAEAKTGDSDRGETSKYRKQRGRKFPFKCYNCGRRGHAARNCLVKPNEEGNQATAQNEESWDAEAFMAHVEEAEALTSSTGKKLNKLDEWIVDSGCSNHMTGDKDRLQNPIPYGGSQVVVIADNSKHQIAHIGDVLFPTEGNKNGLTLKDVYHVPGMKKNLLSVPQLTLSGHYVLFGPKDVKIYKTFETNSTPMLQGTKTNSIYVLSAQSAYIERAKQNHNADLWHYRLGHVGFDKLKLMIDRKLVNGLPQLDVIKDSVCAGCQYGKASQKPFTSSDYKAVEPLALVHTDVFGAVKQPSIRGMQYMVTFIDDFSRYTWVYFMKEKSEVLSRFKEFEAEAERETGYKVRCLRSDNGGEYLSHEFDQYLKQRRIKRQLTCPNTPQQNGVSERKNRHLAEVTRSMMHDKNLPGRFWAEAMRTAAYVINRIPSQGLRYVSPFESLFTTKPNVHYFRVFGCVCYVFVPGHLRHKMEKKAVRCVFVGYDSERKGWRCCDPSTGKVYTSRNVVFDENSSWWSPTKEVLPDTEELKNEYVNSQVTLKLNEESEESEQVVIESNGQNISQHTEQTLRRSERARKPNPRYAGVALVEPKSFDEAVQMEEWIQVMQGEVDVLTHNKAWDLVEEWVRKPNPKFAGVALVDDLLTEPQSFEEATLKEEWVQAMQEEMDALMQNQTWDLVQKPEGVKPISCKWVFKVKQRANGTVERYKARLVARGFSQQPGLDYEETFSPVARLTTIRVVLALAACKGWEMFQMDVSNAFLYGDLDHTIFMEQPKGFESTKELNLVCKLRKALYGLKQSPRAWFGKIGEFLEMCGFSMTNADSSMFVKRLESKVVIVLIYVDDFIITGDIEDEIVQLKVQLSVRFKMKDLGKLHHFLGLELSYSGEDIVLHQGKYTTDVLQKFRMLSCKQATTPLDAGMKLYAHEGKELDDPTDYRKMVGSLIYLTLTRPDISFAVGVLSRFMQKPRKPHMFAMKRVLRYLKSSMGRGVVFKRELKPKLMGYCDADYAGDLNERRSTSGYVFFLGPNAVSWCSKRQPTVSLSSTESEYRAATVAAQECVWLVRLLEDLNQEVGYKVRLLCDNQSAIKLAENPVFHARTKHIEVHYHFIREKVLRGEIVMESVATQEQVADMFTKSLSGPKLQYFCKEMGLSECDVEREC